MNKNILIGVIITLSLLFFFTQEPETVYREIVTTDTVTVVRIDTVTIFETVVRYRTRIDTVYTKDADTVTVYNTEFGLQYGSLRVFTHATGKLIDQYIEIQQDIPVETKYVTITNNVDRIYHHYPLYLGLGGKLSVGPEPAIGIGFNFSNRNNMFAYHYDTNRYHWITYHRQFELNLPKWIK